MERGVVECEEVAHEYGPVAKRSDVSFDRLGHSLLRCLCVGLEYGAFAGKLCVAIVRPSARRSCMASAAAIRRWRVLLSIVGRVVWVLGSGVWSVERRALMFR